MGRNLGRPNADDRSRDPILAAAAEAFMVNGYAGTSVDDIADRLGASKGRIYHYYRSKADILFDIHRNATERHLAAVRPIAEQSLPAPERLRLMAEEHVRLIVNDVASAKVTQFSALTQSYSTERQRKAYRELARLRREYEFLFESTIDEGIHDGVVRSLDTPIVVKALLGALNWVAAWYKPGSDTQERKEQIARETAEYVVDGLCTRKCG